MCRHISPMRIYPKNKTKQCKIHSTSAHISWATIKQEQAHLTEYDTCLENAREN